MRQTGKTERGARVRELLTELEAAGVLRANAVRDEQIRRRFAELRAGGCGAGAAIKAIAAEENISEKRIDAIVYGYG